MNPFPKAVHAAHRLSASPRLTRRRGAAWQGATSPAQAPGRRTAQAHPGRRGRPPDAVPLAALLVAMLLVVAPAPDGARAESLVTRQLDLPAFAQQVLPMRWQGQPVVMVRLDLDGQVPGLPAGPRLWLVALRGDAPAVLQSWPLPGNTRWVEPLGLSGGRGGWLGLQGNLWQVGLAQGAGLVWHPLCSCPTVYDEPNTAPDPLTARFALDLDGDGVDELVLPQRQGLAVYRIGSQPLLAEPLWLDLWNAAASDLPRLKDDPGYAVPAYRLLEMGAGRQPVLAQLLPTGLAVYRHPEPARWPKALRWGGAAHAPLQGTGLPESLRRALLAVPAGTYPDAESLAARLTAGAGAPAEEWAGQWTPVLEQLRPPARLVPVQLPLPQLPPPEADDHAFVLALDDMTGDGVPDVLHAVIQNEKQVLRTKSALRFYPGTLQDGQLAFAGAPVLLRNDGPAVAQVVQMVRQGPVHADLLVARTDVSLGALLQALSSHQVSLQTSLYAFGPAGLQAQPLYETSLTFRRFQEGTPVLLLAADLAGTGLRQVLMNLEPDVLSVFPGGPQGPDLRAAPPWQVRVALPRKREEAFVGSWSGDTREQVLFWYRGGHASPELRRTLRWVWLRP